MSECVSCFWVEMCSSYLAILNLDGEYEPLYRPIPSRHGIPGMRHLHFCFRCDGWSIPGEKTDAMTADTYSDWHMLHVARAIDVIGAHWHYHHVPECDLIITLPQFAPVRVEKVEGGGRGDTFHDYRWSDGVLWQAKLGCIFSRGRRERRGSETL